MVEDMSSDGNMMLTGDDRRDLPLRSSGLQSVTKEEAGQL